MLQLLEIILVDSYLFFSKTQLDSNILFTVKPTNKC